MRRLKLDFYTEKSEDESSRIESDYKRVLVGE